MFSLAYHSDFMRSLTFFLKSVCDILILVISMLRAFLAGIFAFSLPLIPTWIGIQAKITFVFLLYCDILSVYWEYKGGSISFLLGLREQITSL